MRLTEQQLQTCMQATGQQIVYEGGHYWLLKDGKRYLLMPWRTNKRLNNMRQVMTPDFAAGVSAMKAECVVQQCYPLLSLAAKEIDICEWVLGDTLEEVFALTDERHVFHLIGRMSRGARITIDISNTLHENVRETERHEVFARGGSLVDLPVGMQLATEDIYAFRSDSEYPETFSEVILGDTFYTREEAAIIRDIQHLLADEKALAQRETRLDELMRMVNAAICSSQNLTREEVQA